jgi:Glycosyl transferase family 2
VTVTKVTTLDGEVPPARLVAVGVVVPVRDEELLLAASLSALMRAMRRPQLADVAVRVAVVLDGCVDRSAEIAYAAAGGLDAGARNHRLTVMEVGAANVGVARHIGLCAVLEDLEAHGIDGTWLATTDADSEVPVSWLSHQLTRRARGVDAWAGTVRVEDWTDRPMALRASFHFRYHAKRGEGGHVHGANMGFSAGAYLRAGGFPPVATAEDHGLWRRFGEIGARRIHDHACPVVTSSRHHARAPEGFAGALDDLQGQLDQELEDAE